jgi:hypothetical protein
VIFLVNRHATDGAPAEGDQHKPARADSQQVEARHFAGEELGLQWFLE